MNTKNLTDPQIQDALRAAMNTKPMNTADLGETFVLIKARSLTRKDKIRAASLLTKYRYESDPQRFQA